MVFITGCCWCITFFFVKIVFWKVSIWEGINSCKGPFKQNKEAILFYGLAYYHISCLKFMKTLMYVFLCISEYHCKKCKCVIFFTLGQMVNGCSFHNSLHFWNFYTCMLWLYYIRFFILLDSQRISFWNFLMITLSIHW